MNTINHLDLFSGVGGFSLGLREAGVQVGWHGFSDIDKYANKIFKRRFPNAKELGTVESIKSDELPRIDLITFGFPCQDLSIAGKRKGFDGSRSSLFFESIKIIEATKPQYFVFENVKGFFSSNDGKDFATALQTVADIGYDGQWQLLNTRWFLPQNRERIYFVGHIRGECRPEVFPVRESSKTIASKQRKGSAVSCIDANYHKGVDGKRTMIDTGLNQIGVIGKDSEATRVYDTTCAKTIKDGGGMGAKTGLYEIPEANTLDTGMQQYIIQSVGIKNPLKGKSGYGWHFEQNVYDDDGITRSLKASEGSGNKPKVITQSGIRRLTPTECERLQGFPDGWTEGQSDTQRYKQMGNAVSVPVVKSIMEKLYI